MIIKCIRTEDLLFIPDSEADRRKAIPEVTSQGLTTASKEGTNNELDRMGRDQQNIAAAVVLPSLSSSASASTAQASTYRPHAIVVNVIQVSGTVEPL
jgi:hypothetical protein